uniref:Uncharacterized protein n=1 Tax=Cucumis melo TaxID=3656 RepID=A0A9I9EDN3_CUCME
MRRENNLSRRTTKTSARIRQEKGEEVVAIFVALPPLFRRRPSPPSLAVVPRRRLPL